MKNNIDRESKLIEIQEKQMTQHQMDRAIVEREEDTNCLRFQYYTHALYFAIGGALVASLFLGTQVINCCWFVKVCAIKFSTVMVSFVSLIFAFWFLVGKGLFK